ncbi:MAG TPA: hypothetical protein VN203_23695 [Candidatus Acidoferrum sp.]|nr:hypothetical protein [Candidatus Acidoferrum sp.]
MSVHDWPWVGIVLLGIWHGINPGMGWLFAVALGLQEQFLPSVRPPLVGPSPPVLACSRGRFPISIGLETAKAVSLRIPQSM